MRVWKLDFTEGYQEVCPVIGDNIQKLNQLSRGEVLNDWETVEFKCDDEGEKGDFINYWNSYNMPLINERVEVVLREYLEENCQLLDVVYEGKKIKIINVLNVGDFLNFDKCDFERIPEPKLFFDKDKIKDQHIFIPKKPNGIELFDIFFSDEIKEKIEESELKGIEFELVWDENPDVMKKVQYENNPNIRVVSDEEYFKHIESNYGRIYKELKNVDRSFASIDLFITKPNDKVPYYGVFTSGYSFSKTMIPSGFDCGYVEFVLNLPEDYEKKNIFNRKKDYEWAIEMIRGIGEKTLKRGFWMEEWYVFPNQSSEDQYEAFKATIGMGEFNFKSEIMPYAENTEYCGVMVVPPIPKAKNIRTQEYIERDKVIQDEWPIYYKTIIPIYRNEIEYYYREGKDALVSKLMELGINELYDLRRKSVV